MSDVLTKMKTRRSIRKYKPDAVGSIVQRKNLRLSGAKNF